MKPNSHKSQHHIPQSYLSAWCDPETPAKQTPYIWIFTKDGNKNYKKSPKNSFCENDMYTTKSPDGERDLSIEHDLSTIESLFIQTRDNTLSEGKDLTANDKKNLCAFIAAMKGRTIAFREAQMKQWGHALKVMDDIKKNMDASLTTSENISNHFLDAESPTESLTHSQVKELATNPLQKLLPSMISKLPEILIYLDVMIFKADDSSSFITSDKPCVWHDPEAYKRPPDKRVPSLAYPTTEIALPVSPKHFLVLNQQGRNGYYSASEAVVDECNRFTRLSCNEFFVVNSNFTKNAWFNLD